MNVLITKLKNKHILLSYLLYSRCKKCHKCPINHIVLVCSAVDVELLCTATLLIAEFILLKLKQQPIHLPFLECYCCSAFLYNGFLKSLKWLGDCLKNTDFILIAFFS